MNRKKTKAAQRPGRGVPGSEQDAKRRLGDFTGAGEHARQGGRTSGIVGQTTKRLRTDKRGPDKRGPDKSSAVKGSTVKRGK